MGYFKNLDIEIRELDFRGVSVQEIANRMGLTVQVVLAVLGDDIDDDKFDCVESEGAVQ
jgi:hypothetical protein